MPSDHVISPTPIARTVRVHVCPTWLRVVTGALRALAGASLVAILALVVLAANPPVTPPLLVRLVAALALIPWLAAAMLAAAVAADASVTGGDLVLRGRRLHVEVPGAAVARIVPWRVPLPAPGLSLVMRSGRRFSYGLAARDPTPLVAALAAAGSSAASDALAHPVLAYARARPAARRWYHLLARFPLFALAPAGILFYTHQHIAYGAFLGEYYLLGLRAWLTTLAVYWLTLTIYLVLYASLLRALAEAVALAAAYLAPARARSVRRAVEVSDAALYYGGVPLLLVLRYWPW